MFPLCLLACCHPPNLLNHPCHIQFLPPHLPCCYQLLWLSSQSHFEVETSIAYGYHLMSLGFPRCVCVCGAKGLFSDPFSVLASAASFSSIFSSHWRHISVCSFVSLRSKSVSCCCTEWCARHQTYISVHGYLKGIRSLRVGDRWYHYLLKDLLWLKMIKVGGCPHPGRRNCRLNKRTFLYTWDQMRCMYLLIDFLLLLLVVFKMVAQ